MARDRGRRRPRRGALAVVGLASLACLSLPLSSVAPALAASVSPAASTTPLDSFSGVTPTAWLMSQYRDAARASTAWPDYDLAFGAEDEVPAPGAPLPASEDLSNLTPEQLLNLLVARSIAVGTPEALASRYISPVPGPITSAFGPRFHPILHFVRNHNGVDMTAACGTPVVAIADGVVSRSGAAGGYGNLVEVNHGKVDGDTMASRYAHLSVIGVPLGARVSKGQQIGLAGTTGLSTGCHLHFEVLINGAYVNPAAVLSGAPHVRLDTPMVPGLATPPVPGGRIPVAPPHEPHPLPDLPPLTPAPSGTPLSPATPSPEPSHTPTPEPSVTPTPEPSVTPTPTPTPEPSVTPTPTPEPSTTPTPTPEPSVTPTPSGTPEPSATPTTSGSATPSGTPTQSDSPTPEASASPTP